MSKENDDLNIRILNGKNKTYFYRQIFRQDNFEFIKKAYGKGYWQKKIIQENIEEISKYKEFCKKNKLKLELIESEFTRSSDYRTTFFAKNPGFHDRYICAYCGKILKKENVTVDHVFPIDKVSRSSFYKKIVIWLNIKNINDYKNLVCACKKCNSSKGSKMGLWILRGFLGKHIIYWCLLWTSSLILMYLLIMFVIKNLI